MSETETETVVVVELVREVVIAWMRSVGKMMNGPSSRSSHALTVRELPLPTGCQNVRHNTGNTNEPPPLAIRAIFKEIG